MAVFKCKMCGGELDIKEGATIAQCLYCRTKQTLPKLDDDRRANLYNRANHFRRNNEFDKAMGMYEQILSEDTTDAEAYWSIVLCEYGIKYEEDPATKKHMPTMSRTQYTSIFDDANYKSAIEYADFLQREIYEEEARAINEIQKGILAISQNEKPFDVFICYKETDSLGERTRDSVIAQELYYELTEAGFKVFFARITLEDKLGSAYEPYIFAALNSAKVMVAVGTKPEHFNAVWVKNEWSRFLALIKKDHKKILIPAYRDMDPYDLPEEFSHLQAQDMSKLGFMQDLIRGIKKIVEASKPAVIKETTVVTTAPAGSDVAPLLRRVFLFIEDGDWSDANEYCEKVLDIYPECAEAYLAKLMIDLKIRKRELLGETYGNFESNSNYLKAIRFGDEAMRAELAAIVEKWAKYFEEKYSSAKLLMEQNTLESLQKALSILNDMLSYKDSKFLADQCVIKLQEAEKAALTEAKYSKASAMTDSGSIPELNTAVSILREITPYKDSALLIERCLLEIQRIEKEAELEKIYVAAKALMESDNIPDLTQAADDLKSIAPFKDSDLLVEQCYKMIEDIKKTLKTVRILLKNSHNPLGPAAGSTFVVEFKSERLTQSIKLVTTHADVPGQIELPVGNYSISIKVYGYSDPTCSKTPTWYTNKDTPITIDEVSVPSIQISPPSFMGAPKIKIL